LLVQGWRRDGKAALSESAARRCPQRVRLACFGARPDLLHGAGRHDARHQVWTGVWSAAKNTLDDGFDASPALVDNEITW